MLPFGVFGMSACTETLTFGLEKFPTTPQRSRLEWMEFLLAQNVAVRCGIVRKQVTGCLFAESKRSGSGHVDANNLRVLREWRNGIG